MAVTLGEAAAAAAGVSEVGSQDGDLELRDLLD